MRIVILALVLLSFAYADTLNLRNGTSVSGSWVAANSDTVRFLVNDQVLTYPRADVLSVILGAEAPATSPNPAPVAPPATSVPVAPPPVTPAPPPPASVAPAPAAPTAAPTYVPPAGPPSAPRSGAEPEWLGAVYFQDSTGAFLPLERTTGASIGAAYGIARGANIYLIHGPRSSFRVKRDQKMLFAVRLAGGYDPRRFYLYPLVSKKGDRVTKPVSKGITSETLPVTVTKFGTSSWSLVPVANLPPGEYAFSPNTTTDAYCFGVD